MEIIEKYFKKLDELFAEAEFDILLELLTQENQNINITKVNEELGKEILELESRYNWFKKLKRKGKLTNQEYIKYIEYWKDDLKLFLDNYKAKITEIINKIDGGQKRLAETIEHGEVLNETEIEHLEIDVKQGFEMVNDINFEKTIIQKILPKMDDLPKTVNFPVKLTSILTLGVLISSISIYWEYIDFQGRKIGLLTNFILHIFVIILMINIKIKPKITVDQFEKKFSRDNFLNNMFGNRFELYKFYIRTNLVINQFGYWWIWLGISFLAIYLYYFLFELWHLANPEQKIYSLFSLFEISLNGLEALFLYILYKLLTDKTIKRSFDATQRTIKYINNVRFKNALIAFLSLTVLLFIFGISFENSKFNESFQLIARVLCSLGVAVGFALIVGRLDSKFIGANKIALTILYLYSSIQVLFILFDQSIYENVLVQHSLDVVQEYIQNLDSRNNSVSQFYDGFKNWYKHEPSNLFEKTKLYALWAILILKICFLLLIYFIHHSNRLFYYFLVGSKINEYIEAGINFNPWVISNNDLLDRILPFRNNKLPND